jgi:hypothetical protein
VVPPDGLAVRVIDCPVSMVGTLGVIAPATKAGLTVTVSVGEHCETGWKAESVTRYAYVVVTEGVVTYVGEVAPDIARLQVPSEYHR